MHRGLWRIWILAATCSWAGSSAAVQALPACAGEERPGRVSTCVSTGDRGWYRGGRWRLKDVEAPEIDGRMARCRAEQIMGIRARDRLRVLMALGYTIVLTGRDDGKGWSLVTMRLFDGRDAASQLLSEGVVQALPNSENRWCTS